MLEDLKGRAVSGDSAVIGYAGLLAELYGVLGEQDEAFASLERAYQRHESNLADLAVDPLFDPLRSDPRFKQLLKKMRLGE